MNVRFSCPVCETQVRVELPGALEWHCPGCDHVGKLAAAHDAAGLNRCAACGNHELYRKKDFPHRLGLTILTVACVVSVVPYWLYMQWLTWAILLGSVVIDGLLYLAVGDVVVCYQCDAHHRGYTATSAHEAFELTTHERYRQEKIRRELMASRGHGSKTESLG